MNTYKVLSFIIFLAITINICAQTTYFNKQISIPNHYIEAKSILPTDSGYSTITNIGNVNGQIISFINLDYQGNIKSSKTYQDSGWHYFCGNGGSLEKISNGYILGFSKKNKASDICFAGIMKFDNDGDTIWSKIFKDIYWGQNYMIGAQVKPTTDNGYILTGTITKAINNYSIFVLKTDSLGNEQWRKYIGNSGNGISNFTHSILNTLDKGYIIGAYTQDNNNIGPGGYILGGNVLIVKVDSLGNQEWIKPLGGIHEDSGGSITITKDSNYLVAMAYDTCSSPTGLISKICLVKLSKSGSILWLKEFGSYKYENAPWMIKALENGGYIAVGSSYNSNVNTLELFAWIMRFDENGDSIWYRQYRNYWESRYIPHNLLDVNQTTDGGFVACGKIYDAQGSFADMWVIKFDSNGCINSGCTTGIEVEDEAFASKQFTIFPNPATNEIHLEFDKSMQSEEKQVFIFDATGRLIKQLRFDKNETEPSISVQDLDQGIYFIKVIVNNKEEMSDKFLKL